ncbi:hypothetical protein [Archangium sp.]|uniref:hypothetical protein n=1 Tax=Archangium sp. TaxID=1872627 RepID=UPI00389A05DB
MKVDTWLVLGFTLFATMASAGGRYSGEVSVTPSETASSTLTTPKTAAPAPKAPTRVTR